MATGSRTWGSREDSLAVLLGNGDGTFQTLPVVPLTFEEGLERLKERHEALTQSVELMAAENRERDQRLGQIMEGIARLLHVAEIHENRPTRLEGGE